MSVPEHCKKPLVAIVGNFQIGKSTLVNCLLDDKYVPTGNGLPTTSHNCRFCFGEAEEAFCIKADGNRQLLERREELFVPQQNLDVNDQFLITAWKPILHDVDIVDTPGFNEKDSMDKQAERIMAEAELIIVLLADKTADAKSKSILTRAFDLGKKTLCLFNCRNFERWAPEDNWNICEAIEADLTSSGLSENLLKINGKGVYPVNALWAWYALGHLQRDLDSADTNVRNNAEMEIKKIQKHWKNEPRRSKRDILQASGILCVRHTLEQYISLSLDGLCQNHQKEIKALVERWQKQIRQTLA